jgi:hypothetical protein
MQPSALGTEAYADTAAERDAQIIAQVRPLELLALDDMRRADEETDTGAPLLSGERHYGLSGSHGDDRESTPAGSSAASRRDSGTWFIWALTLSAGISGLLFGYEYVILYLQEKILKSRTRYTDWGLDVAPESSPPRWYRLDRTSPTAHSPPLTRVSSPHPRACSHSLPVLLLVYSETNSVVNLSS